MTTVNNQRAIERLLNNLPLVDQHDLLVQLIRDSKPSDIVITQLERLGDICDRLGVFTPKFSVQVHLNDVSAPLVNPDQRFLKTDIITPEVREKLNAVMAHG